MIIAGIDPSLTRTAICSGRTPADCKVSVVESAACPNNLAARYERFEKLASKTIEAVGAARIVFIEGFSYGSKGRGTVTLGEYGGVLRTRLRQLDKDVIEVAPRSLKLFVNGKGSCSKAAYVNAATRRWGIGEGWDEDEFFAYGLWRFGLVYCKRMLPETTAQRQAIEGIA